MTEDNGVNATRADVREAREYLETGGLGEVYGMAEVAASVGQPKVQMDTAMALALCEMYFDLTEGSDNGRKN